MSRNKQADLVRAPTRAKMSGNSEHKAGRSSPESGGQTEDDTVVATQNGAVINASGYKDQLKRQYGLLGLAGIALTVDNAWIALGSSISVSIGMSDYPALRDSLTASQAMLQW